MRASFIALVVLLASVASCGRGYKPVGYPSSSGTTKGSAQLDSVRGTIVLTGPAPAYIVTLVTKDGQNLSLTGPYSRALLDQLDGLNVMAYGDPSHHTKTAFVMDSFSVHGRGEQPARDGILRRTASGDFLELADGRRLAIPHLSGYLADADGKRIWIAGPMEAPTGMSTLDPDRPSGRLRRTPVAHP